MRRRTHGQRIRQGKATDGRGELCYIELHMYGQNEHTLDRYRYI